ncbi:MAG: TetR/AcrR family transcriptional regulator [Haliscomenobacter sp.]
MDGFERRKEQSKEDIRKAASELFSQFGVDRVSIADIARKAGISQATIYNNFGSKDAIVREFVTNEVEHLITRVEKVLSPTLPYREKMAAFLQFIVEMMASGRPSVAGNTVFASSVDIQNDPQIKKIRIAAREKMNGLMLNLVRDGRQQGQVSVAISDEALVIYFGAFMDIFSHPELLPRYYQNPGILQELGILMMFGLKGE